MRDEIIHVSKISSICRSPFVSIDCNLPYIKEKYMQSDCIYFMKYIIFIVNQLLFVCSKYS